MALGKVFDKEEINIKILKSLYKNWQPKVTAISESKDLIMMNMATLFGTLRKHKLELGILKDEEEIEEKKSIALKASSKNNSETDMDKKELMTLMLQEFSKKTVVIFLEGDSKGDNLRTHCLIKYCTKKAWHPLKSAALVEVWHTVKTAGIGPAVIQKFHIAEEGILAASLVFVIAALFWFWVTEEHYVFDVRTLDVGIVGRTSIKINRLFAFLSSHQLHPGRHLRRADKSGDPTRLTSTLLLENCCSAWRGQADSADRRSGDPGGSKRPKHLGEEEGVTTASIIICLYLGDESNFLIEEKHPWQAWPTVRFQQGWRFIP
ncbi:hypothetical protein V8G54_030331 [Vigna mungo]|uniref:UBN2 domain-containing protein n=1 Tax=Vigna mungo TaxID=3915 RepID=A0AAQ3MVY4_VIGMU